MCASLKSSVASDVEFENNFNDGRILLLVLFLGFVLIIAGIALFVVAALVKGGSGSSGFGAVILIGPFPLIVGAGSDVSWLMLLVVVLCILNVVLFLLARRKKAAPA
jgi:uncharacterized membrane protein